MNIIAMESSIDVLDPEEVDQEEVDQGEEVVIDEVTREPLQKSCQK